MGPITIAAAGAALAALAAPAYADHAADQHKYTTQNHRPSTKHALHDVRPATTPSNQPTATPSNKLATMRSNESAATRSDKPAATPSNKPGAARSDQPAAARSGEPDVVPGPGTALVLSVTGRGVPVKSAVLYCDPPRGTHPKAAEACAELGRTGDIAHLPAAGALKACYQVYSPVTVTAEGHLRGDAVRFQASYPNECVMRTQTGTVFDL